MTAYADLEIGLHRRDADSYAVELRYTPPESDADIRLVRGGPALVRLDFSDLRAQADAASYGHRLGESLFADRAVWTAFCEARSAAQAADAALHLRLFIGPSAPELHSLRWETLCDPEDGTSLLTTGEQIAFSRYLSSTDWRPVRLRPRADLNALVVVANPAELAKFRLAPLNVGDEVDRARASLHDIPVKALASGGSATLDNMIDELRGNYDILYLVCHGTWADGEPWLWLEDAAGNIAREAGSELVNRLRQLQQRPSLVVLASCQSAGSGADARGSDEGALAALGPRLAEAGIPAVLAMQGSVSMPTVAEFMPRFFAELQSSGQIDRAMAVARGSVLKHQDWWMPVLFMRLKSGRIWYARGFADDRNGFDKWPALLGSIDERHCTPILGPGLIEPLLGAPREIAQRCADKNLFPMSPHSREDLPRVAQYVAVKLGYPSLRRELNGYAREAILDRYGDDLSEDQRRSPLDELMTAVGAKCRERDPMDPHRLLARLPIRVYITTNIDNLLAEALAAEGKHPRVELCRWNKHVRQLPSIADTEPTYRPDPQNPLVYHLFGRAQEPRSLVLTEDDYFDYLIGMTKDAASIPAMVRAALVNSALLFLGFQMDDWNFRVLFRSLGSQEGRDKREDYPHIAAQIDPEEDRILDPARARSYLESYFGEARLNIGEARVNIYWGSTEDFVRELWQRWIKEVGMQP